MPRLADKTARVKQGTKRMKISKQGSKVDRTSSRLTVSPWDILAHPSVAVFVVTCAALAWQLYQLHLMGPVRRGLLFERLVQGTFLGSRSSVSKGVVGGRPWSRALEGSGISRREGISILLCRNGENDCSGPDGDGQHSLLSLPKGTVMSAVFGAAAARFGGEYEYGVESHSGGQGRAHAGSDSNFKAGYAAGTIGPADTGSNDAPRAFNAVGQQVLELSDGLDGEE